MIVREALFNVLEHSAATHVYCRFLVVHDHLQVAIQDDGRGVDASLLEAPKGRGITNMMARVRNLGGHWRWQSRTAEVPGLRIELSLPLNKSPANAVTNLSY